MYNCLIFGSGRSGTSLVTGSLKNSGYYMGNRFIPPRDANPKGFFEDPFINHDINEEILKKAFPRLKLGQRWLGIINKNSELLDTEKIRQNIKRMIKTKPFCFKDPRFSYTLPVWQKYIPKNTKFVCVFRYPAATINSILLSCRTDKYLKSIRMDVSRGNKIWEAIYTNILGMKLSTKKILYMHYNQMFSEEGVHKLECFLNAKVLKDFPDSSLIKPIPKDMHLSNGVKKIYSVLCNKANYSVQ